MSKRTWYVIVDTGHSRVRDEIGEIEPTVYDIEYCEKYLQKQYGVPCVVVNVFSVLED